MDVLVRVAADEFVGCFRRIAVDEQLQIVARRNLDSEVSRWCCRNQLESVEVDERAFKGNANGVVAIQPHPHQTSQPRW